MDYQTICRNASQKLREYKDANKLSIVSICKTWGTQHSTLYRILRLSQNKDMPADMQMSSMSKIAKTLGFSLTQLIDLCESEKNEKSPYKYIVSLLSKHKKIADFILSTEKLGNEDRLEWLEKILPLFDSTYICLQENFLPFLQFFLKT